MRLQRGRLRALGYKFRGDEEGYSYLNTLNIHRDNVIDVSADEHPLESNHPIDWSDSNVRREYLGEDSPSGIQVAKHQGKLVAFPRICPHEGASLDNADLIEGEHVSIRCSWHGRKFQGVPLCEEEFRTVGSCSAKLNELGVTIRRAQRMT